MSKVKLWSSEDAAKFYASDQWKELKAAFKNSLPRGSKRKCSCCGKVSSKLHVDHIMPISKDPSRRLDINNLQLLCRACNLGKSNKDSSRMSSLSDEQRKLKAAKFKKEFWTKKWFAPTTKKSMIRSASSKKWKEGFF